MLKASMELPAGDEFSGRDRRDERFSPLFIPLHPLCDPRRGIRGFGRKRRRRRRATSVPLERRSFDRFNYGDISR